MKLETLENQKQQALQQAAAAQEQVLKLEAQIKEASAKAQKEAEEKRIAEQLESRSAAFNNYADYIPTLQAQTKAMLKAWEKAKQLAKEAGLSYPERLERLMLPVAFLDSKDNPTIAHSWMYGETEEHKAAIIELGIKPQ